MRIISLISRNISLLIFLMLISLIFIGNYEEIQINKDKFFKSTRRLFYFSSKVKKLLKFNQIDISKCINSKIISLKEVFK